MSNSPARLPEFNYIGQYRYFLTICVNLRATVFFDPPVARHVIEQFLRIAASEEFEVLAYCIDPREYPFLGAEKYDVAALLESSFFWTPPWK